MADSPLSSPTSVSRAGGHGEPPRKQQKRSYVAPGLIRRVFRYYRCLRCHGHKVKCSGGNPCQRCQKAKAFCQYPLRDKRSSIAQSDPRQQRNTNNEQDTRHTVSANSSIVPVLQRENEMSTRISAARRQVPDQFDEQEHGRELTVAPSETPDLYQQEQVSLQELHGESTCLAFYRQYYRSHVFDRSVAATASYKLPDRVRAILLVRVAIRFIGQDYHLFLRDEFLQQLERAYSSKNSGHAPDALWSCKFYIVLALGELYSTSSTMSANRMGDPGAVSGVPGTAFFEIAMGLLQDLYEEPSTSQIEIMLLFCFYSNALGRTRSAHIYSGLALRLSTCLGLHRRSKKSDSTMAAIEQEQHLIRLFWTCYIFDRSTSSRLGVPMSIQDSDIDVQMPSVVKTDKLAAPDHLIANIELSRITGCIMRDIYGPSNKANPGRSLFQNIRTNLQKLCRWDANLPSTLRLSQAANLQRPASSLHLHFNQCIILTTRPVLLYVLKTKDPFNTASRGDSANPQQVSDTAKMLAESCIAAARTSSSVLSQLYTENALATYGYFDAHHLFSSAIILIMSAILSPNPSDSDAVQTAFHLLKTMRDCGNTIAMDYYTCLTNIQSTIGRLRSQTLVAGLQKTPPDTTTIMNNNQANSSSLDTPNFEDHDWDMSMLLHANLAEFDNLDNGNFALDPLGDPMLQTFLNAQLDTSWDPSTTMSMVEHSRVAP